MLAYAISLAVFLSFLAKAESAKSHMYALDNQTGLYAIGAWAAYLSDGLIPMYDVVNTTKCYCLNETDMSRPTYGYYYQFNYWNYPLYRSYSTSTECIHRGPHPYNASRSHEYALQNRCLLNIYGGETLHSESTYGDNDDIFTFHLDDPKPYPAFGSHYLSQGNSAFKFSNSDWQKLPRKSSDYLSPVQSLANCEHYCKEKLGMETIGFIQSQKLAFMFGLDVTAELYNGGQSFEDLDDLTVTPQGLPDLISIGSLKTLPFFAIVVLATVLALGMV
ncbi:hypothetical protein N7G274_005836 [Stereocaulon virgatum]|uniref:Uncharacterized protein n=1 Tax=Stereocaulon virgatum TaxID=373712 RepID=A0ABR4A7H1_9LECA